MAENNTQIIAMPIKTWDRVSQSFFFSSFAKNHSPPLSLVYMTKKLYWALFVLILLGAFCLRLVPALNGNFFFTSDQARDMVAVRDLVEGHKLLTKGPETTIPGISVGPGWYYFLAIGYLLFSGNPFGSVFLMIVLAEISLALIMLFFKRIKALNTSLILGSLLSINWFFYDTSRYAFNPFPLVLVGIVLIVFLTKFFSGNKNYFALGLIPVGLAFNANIAGAGAFLLMYIACGVWAVKKKKLSLKQFILFAGILPGLGLIFLLKQLWYVYQTTRIAGVASTIGTFTSVAFIPMLGNFAHILANSLVPQSIVISVVIFVFLILVKKTGKIKLFFNLVSLLFGVSYIWFSWSKGWKDWQTVYLPSLIFVASVAVILRQKKRLLYLLLIPVLLGQITIFVQRYLQYLKPSGDQAILINQEHVFDWIYSHADQDGFNSYVYTESAEFDWQYQYLYWWYGRKKYGYLPCEYAMYPKFQKQIFLPTFLDYSEPKLGCDWNTFFIVEPGKDAAKYRDWLTKLRQDNIDGIVVSTTHVNEVKIAKIRRVN